MRQLFVTIILVFIFSNLWGKNSGRVNLSRVTPDGGVSYTSVNCIGEDERGFIWFGTNNGLFSYNSFEITKYSYDQNNPTSIPTNRINKIYTDFAGRLWIATENGLCFYNSKSDNFTTPLLKDQSGNITGKVINSFLQAADSTYWLADERGFGTLDLASNKVYYKNINNKDVGVRTISTDDKGTIWVFFSDGDIYYLQKGLDSFRYFSKDSAKTIRSVFVDNENIWIAYELDGLLCMGLDGQVKYRYGVNSGLPSNQVRDIIKDENGKIWAATYNGITIIENYKIVSQVNVEKYPELPNHSIWTFFKDSQKNIWIGTWLGGLCFHSEYNNSIVHYTQSAPKNSLSYNVVSSFVQVPGKSEIIVGTEDGLLNYFNPETNLFSQISINSQGIKVKNIKSLAFDQEETLWIGTYETGVFYKKRHSNTFNRLITPFATGFNAFYFCATEDGIWVSDYPQGVYFYNFKSKSFKRFQHFPLDINSISDGNVSQIIRDKNGNMWFATRNGLNLLKKGSDQFVHFFHQENNPTSISSNLIYTILEDTTGFLWLGTNGQGLDKMNPETGTVEHFTTKEGYPWKEIFSILQDQKKNLWITTDKGLYRINPVSLETRSFEGEKGIQNNNFNPNASLFAANGEIYFGGTNGFVRFIPEELKSNPIPPSTVLTHFYIHNTEIIPGIQKNSILTDNIGKTKSLMLNYSQNSISFRFATNNYIEPVKNHFRYRLVHFGDEWTETDANGRATFTNIPPGNYSFEVKAANNDGVWNENPTRIGVNIIPPIWERWYARVIYAFLVILLVLFFRRQVINKQILKNEIELEKVNRENEEYLHQMKLQFFTNISHEFRTPLTLIQGPVNRLMKDESDNESKKYLLSLIKNNTERLLRLINQLLDFRKIESGIVFLNPVNAEIVSFCENIFNCFKDYASHRGIDFRFAAGIPSLKMDFDADKLDKILFNILSNAFKYSADGGKITLTIQSNNSGVTRHSDAVYVLGEDISGNFVEICISDTGKGIAKENLPKIFDQFYQIERNTQLGSGIGLALSKSYVLLHKGQLIVKSSENKGSAFYIYIPQSQFVTNNEINPNDPVYLSHEVYSFENQIYPYSKDNFKTEIRNKKALILIVEDNMELLNYIGELLQNDFRITKARNGKEGYEQINSLFPDLIVSDIMMPEINGFELCNMVKKDIKTSHIPIVLLTSLDTVKDRISGLHSGADAYIPKPFEADLLVAQIDSLLESRKLLRESFSLDQEIWDEKYCSLELDKKLLSKAIKVIEANITNENFSVEDMAGYLNLSRTHLYRKLKSLTNQSATEFIRSIRLKHAVKLMKEGKHRVNEIGFAVGFNSHGYFTKSFRKQYGKSPSEFLSDITGKLE